MQEEQLRKRVLILLGLAAFMVMADNWVVSPILPVIAGSLQVSLPKAGLLITAYMVPFGMFQLIYGPLSDRWGKKEIITGSMVFFTVGTALCAAATGWAGLAFFRALTGVFAASVIPISFALLGDIFPLKERQKAIGTFLGICFLGQGSSMIIGGAIAFFSGWKGVFLTYGLFSLIPTALLLGYYRRIPSVRNPGSPIIAPYIALMRNGKSRGTYAVIALEGIFITGAFSFCGAYLDKIHHLDSLHIGFIMTGFGLMSIVAGRLSAWAVRRIGGRRLIPLGLGIASVADLFIWGTGTHLPVCITGIAVMGFGFVLAHTTLVTRTTEFAESARGSAMSLVAFAIMGAGGIGTAIGGKIIAMTSLPTLFLTYGIGLALTALATRFMLR